MCCVTAYTTIKARGPELSRFKGSCPDRSALMYHRYKIEGCGERASVCPLNAACTTAQTRAGLDNILVSCSEVVCIGREYGERWYNSKYFGENMQNCRQRRAWAVFCVCLSWSIGEFVSVLFYWVSSMQMFHIPPNPTSGVRF